MTNSNPTIVQSPVTSLWNAGRVNRNHDQFSMGYELDNSLRASGVVYQGPQHANATPGTSNVVEFEQYRQPRLPKPQGPQLNNDQLEFNRKNSFTFQAVQKIQHEAELRKKAELAPRAPAPALKPTPRPFA